MDVLSLLLNPYGIAIVAIAGGIVSGIFATAQKTRLRELEIRERIAMIERGMVPPPETDPRGFEERMERVHFVQHRYDRYAGNRFRTGGIMVMSVGIGLTMLLWFVGVPRVGIGLGGFLGIIGVGLLVNGLFYSPPPIPPPPPPSAPSQS